MVIVRLSTETGPSFLEVEGFEEKQAQGEKKHEAVYGGTEAQFSQEGSDFPTGAAGDALRGSPRVEEIVEKKTGADNQRPLDQNALSQFLRWRYYDSSEGEAQKNI